MPPIDVKHVISFTSQDPKHPVKDLVEGRGPWLNQKGDKSTSLRADLQLEKATKISYIDIGNAGSVMIGVEVGRSAWPVTRPFVTLIPTLAFMSRAEVTSGQNRNSIRMFKPEDMDETNRNEEWDRVRVLCLQPFPSPSQFGISMIKMYSEFKMTPKAQLTPPARELSPQVTQDKRNALMARLKLSNPENKAGFKDRIKLAATSHPPDMKTEPSKMQQASSPMSRGAQLLGQAARIPTQQENITKKSELECEGLRFLMSLNLSVHEIDHLPIKEIRQKFEVKRQKPLTFAETKIFKDIAVDFAMRRLEVLENQDTAAYLAARGVKTSQVPVKTLQKKRKHDHLSSESKIDKVLSNGSKSSLNGNLMLQENESLKRANKEKQEVNGSVRRFTFGQSKHTSRSPSIQVEETDKEVTPCFEYVKKPIILDKNSYPSENATRIPPKMTKKRKSQKRITKQVEQQSTVGQWITPRNKMKAKETHNDFQYSTKAHLYSESDESDAVCISGDSALPSTPRGKTPSSKTSGRASLHRSPSSVSRTVNKALMGNRLGVAPSNKFNVVVRAVKEAAPPLRQGQQQVDCPLCAGSFPEDEIEEHAASCSITVLSDIDSSDDDSRPASSGDQPSTSGMVEECPVCGVLVAAATLQAHATQCASSMFD